MKKSALQYFLFSLVILFWGCEKNNCPSPIIQRGQPESPTPPIPKLYTYSVKYSSANDYDAHLVYNSFTLGNINYPSHATLYSEAWTNGGLQVARSIIDFPLDNIPQGSTIHKAILTLYADTTNPVSPKFGHSTLGGPNDWVIKKVIVPWNINIVTWNNQPATDNADTLLMAASISGDQRYDIDITKFIKERYANPTSHYGYLLKLNNETPYRSIAFCSSNHQYQQLAPELKVEYTK